MHPLLMDLNSSLPIHSNRRYEVTLIAVLMSLCHSNRRYEVTPIASPQSLPSDVVSVAANDDCRQFVCAGRTKGGREDCKDCKDC